MQGRWDPIHSKTGGDVGHLEAPVGIQQGQAQDHVATGDLVVSMQSIRFHPGNGAGGHAHRPKVAEMAEFLA